MRPRSCFIAIGAFLGASSQLFADDIFFSSEQYGQFNLRLPESLLFLDNALVGIENFEPLSEYSANSRLRQLGRPVGRLDVLYGDGGLGICTTVLVSEKYLITNHHCVAPDSDFGPATSASVVFGYLNSEDTSGARRYIVDPEPVEADEALDYAILMVQGDPSTTWGVATLSPRDPQAGDALLVIQHPAGKPMHVTRRACRAGSPHAIAGNDILHTCDTLPGSSGSPVFSDDDGVMIGLHYAGQGLLDAQGVNAAIRLTQIFASSRLLSSLLHPADPTLSPLGEPSTVPGPEPSALFESCEGAQNAQLRIDACTSVIQSGGLDRSNLSWAFYNRGVALVGIGQRDQAIEDFDEAIHLNPGNAMAYVGRGMAIDDPFDELVVIPIDDAIGNYDQAIRLDPDIAAAYYYRGLTYSSAWQYEQGIQDFNEAIRLDPNYAMIYVSRGIIYEIFGQHDRAISNYNQAIAINPNTVDAYYERGISLINIDQYGAALEDFDQVILIDPNNVRGHNGRGMAYDGLGQFERAIEEYSRAITIDRNFAAAYNNRGLSYYNIGQHQRAIDDFYEALSLRYSEDDWRHIGMAKCAVGDVAGSFAAYIDYISHSQNPYGWQEFLRAVGYYRGAIDGRFGPMSRNALLQWIEGGCPE